MQEKSNWERWVRKIYDQKLVKQIYVSGSSASLLSEDIGRVLSGRHITFQLKPFNFYEYLHSQNWKNFNLNYLLNNQSKLNHYFFKFMKNGGFPEIIDKKEYMQQQINSGLVNDIISRDISSRFRVDMNKIKMLTKYLMTNFTREFSYRKISNDLGIHISTLEKYIGYLEQSFLISRLDLFSYKMRTQFRRNKKIYVIDNGLRNSMSFKTTADFGKMAENIVYNQLSTFNRDIFYWKDKNHEVDFLISKGSDIKELIQVSWDISNPKTKKREIQGIIAVAKIFNKKEGTILTKDAISQETVENIKINIQPLPIWLLRNNH